MGYERGGGRPKHVDRLLDRLLGRRRTVQPPREPVHQDLGPLPAAASVGRAASRLEVGSVNGDDPSEPRREMFRQHRITEPADQRLAVIRVDGRDGPGPAHLHVAPNGEYALSRLGRGCSAASPPTDGAVLVPGFRDSDPPPRRGATRRAR